VASIAQKVSCICGFPIHWGTYVTLSHIFQHWECFT
jgi:hypothetical protein